MRALWMVCFLVISWCCAFPAIASEAADQDYEQQITSQIDQFDFSEIEKLLSRQHDGSGWDFTFKQLMGHLLKGNWSEILEGIGQAIKNTLLGEVQLNAAILGQIVMLAVISAVFTNFSQIFSASQLSETGFFVTYLLIFTCLVSSSIAGISVVSKVVGQVLDFMKVLLPSYFLALAFAGNGISSIALYEFTMIVMSVMQLVIFRILIPLTQVYILLTLTGQLAKEDMLSKLTDLIEQIIRWSLKTMMGAVLGFQLIQGMVLPYVDSLKNASVQKVVGIIPGLGQGVNATVQMILGSGVIIKNTIGAAAIIILIGMVLLPFVKMTVCIVLYQCAAAIMQPICDKRVINCIASVIKGYQLMIQIMGTAAVLFILTIAIACAGSNASYLAM